MLLLFFAALPARPATLSGFMFYGTTATGANVPGAARWNTLGFETITPNLYVFQGSTQICTGNGAAERINVPLSPGTFDFTWCAQPHAIGQAAFFGVNLYFNGDDNQPLITAFVPIHSFVTPSANTNSTFALDGVSGAPSANTISVILDGLLISLVYANVPNEPGMQDKVSLFLDVPDGNLDCPVDGLGLRITVEAIPEPQSGLLLGTAIAGLALIVRRANAGA